MTCRVEESNFLVLNRRSLWARGLADNLDVSEQGLQLQARTSYQVARDIALAQITPHFKVQDFAIGQCSLLYILDANARAIWVYDPTQDRFERLACLDPLFSEPVSMSFFPGTLFVADKQAESRVFAFATINWQIRWVIGERADGAGQPMVLDSGEPIAPFQPLDLATGEDGSLYALDPGNHAIFHFDRGGRLLKIFGQAQLTDTEPTALALGRDGAIYLLVENQKQILRLPAESDGVWIDFQPLIDDGTLPQAFKPHGLGVDAEGHLYVGDQRDRLLNEKNEEDDRFIHQFDAVSKDLSAVAVFRGQTNSLAIDGADRIYIFNQEPERAGQLEAEQPKKLIVLAPEQKFTQPGQTALVKGSYFSRAFDSTALGTLWHKAVFETELPENTQISVAYLASDDKKFFIADQTQTQDLDIYLAAHHDGDEAAIEALSQLDWQSLRVNPRDALLSKAEGRYLWLRVELIGSEKQTPRVKSLRVDFPRRSYLRYLPAVYQQDERSRDFLERFLALYETFFAQMEEQITRAVRYFDAEASVVEGEFLRWLASWFAIAADHEWGDEKLRELVKRAPELYKQRGTRAGLAAMIEIFTGGQPLIVEHFQTQQCPGPLTELLQRLYGSDPYCFCVLLKPGQVPTESARAAVRRIVTAEKPAHTCAGVKTLQPRIQLDFHSYLEINSHLAPPSLRLDVGSALPLDTVLTEADEAGQLERRARLELETNLT